MTAQPDNCPYCTVTAIPIYHCTVGISIVIVTAIKHNNSHDDTNINDNTHNDDVDYNDNNTSGY